MSQVRTRAMRSASIANSPAAPSSESLKKMTPRRKLEKLGDPGPSSREMRREARRKRQKLDEEAVTEIEVLPQPQSDDGGEAEATEPLSVSPASEVHAEREPEQADDDAAQPATENSAALQWENGGDDDAHAMQVEQGEADVQPAHDPLEIKTSEHELLEDELGAPIPLSQYSRSAAIQPTDGPVKIELEASIPSDVPCFKDFPASAFYPIEDADMSSDEESYHSGDTDLFELGHRPWDDRPTIKRDITDLMNSMRSLRKSYQIVDRLGEGTFSSVYLAIDKHYWKYRDDYQRGCLSPRTQEALQEDPNAKVYVALKRIYITSSPQRIQNEIEILESLRGCRNVSQLITAFREGGQVIVSMPYHRNDDFRHFYRLMDMEHISSYMLCLFRGLADIHGRGVIHRDVKPANFLYDYETQRGVIVDFGLAQRYETPWRASTCQHGPATLDSLHGTKIKSATASKAEQAVYNARKRAKLGEGRVGFLSDDKRPSIKTNRAGTRGFRAPEVLLKCPDQTVAIDVWSAGVMLLSILTQRFPVFNSNDDIEALMEIAALFGRAAMERCALLHSRTIITNVPTVDQPVEELKNIVLKLNPNLYVPRCSPTPTVEEAEKHIAAVDQAFSLLKLCLRLDPTKRITAAQAAEHPFFDGIEPDFDASEAADGITWGKIEIEDDKFRRVARGLPKDRYISCQWLHEKHVDSNAQTLVFASHRREVGFGEGVINRQTMYCPEHEQADLVDVWGNHPVDDWPNNGYDTYGLIAKARHYAEEEE